MIWIAVGMAIVVISYIARVTYLHFLKKIPGVAVGFGKAWGKTTDRFRILRAMNSFFYIIGMAVTLVGIVLLLVTPFKPDIVVVPPSILIGVEDEQLEVGKILSLVNDQRKQHNLPPLVENPRLTAIAQARADDMANNQYYAHQSPKGQYYYDLFPEHGFTSEYSCENLDVEFTTDETVYVNDWLESNKGHKECMLNKKATQAGYAVALFGGSKNIYVVVAIHSTELKNLSPGL